MKTQTLALFIISILAISSALPLLVSAKEEPLKLVVIELLENQQSKETAYTSIEDNNDDPDYALTGDYYTGYAQGNVIAAPYYVNIKNKAGLSGDAIITTMQVSTTTWDEQTASAVFSITRAAGKRDGYNVVDFGAYRSGVIAVTMYWATATGKMVEVDMRMNTLYKWSFSGESGKMDVQNIATHEFGHWAGLADLYEPDNSWLTMYGKSTYGVTYQRTLCAGDIVGLQDTYGGL
jgi:hypothetical protein